MYDSSQLQEENVKYSHLEMAKLEYSIVNVTLLLQVAGCTLANFYIPFLTLVYSVWSELLQTANPSKPGILMLLQHSTSLPIKVALSFSLGSEHLCSLAEVLPLHYR